MLCLTSGGYIPDPSFKELSAAIFARDIIPAQVLDILDQGFRDSLPMH